MNYWFGIKYFFFHFGGTNNIFAGCNSSWQLRKPSCYLVASEIAFVKILWIKEIIIEKQIPRNIVKFSKYPSYPPPFYGTQMIKPFLSSMISANHDKVEKFVKSLILIPFLSRYCKISFLWIITFLMLFCKRIPTNSIYFKLLETTKPV